MEKQESGIQQSQIWNPESGSGIRVNWETLKTLSNLETDLKKVSETFIVIPGSQCLAAGRATAYIGTATNQNLTVLLF